MTPASMPIKSNVLIALGILSGMFLALIGLFIFMLFNFEKLGCSATEYGLGIIALLGTCIGAVAWVVKMLAVPKGYFQRRT